MAEVLVLERERQPIRAECHRDRPRSDANGLEHTTADRAMPDYRRALYESCNSCQLERAAGSAPALQHSRYRPGTGLRRITELAAQICGCPVAVIGFVDEVQDWKKSKYGLPASFTGIPREISICSTTICSGNLLHVGDLINDERFRVNAMVSGPSHLRFYCGMPLVRPDGYALGTLCVVDFQPREISFEQGETVLRLARQVVTQLELRRRVIELDHTLAELRESRVAINNAKEKSENLLLSILPAAIAEELKQHGKVMPRHHDAVTILFRRFQGIYAPRRNHGTCSIDSAAGRILHHVRRIGGRPRHGEVEDDRGFLHVRRRPAGEQPHASDRCLPHGTRHAGVCRPDEAPARQVSSLYWRRMVRPAGSTSRKARITG